MREFETSTTINAAPGRIWSILTDVSAYPEWDPSCEKILGSVFLAAKLEVFSTLAPGRAFSVRVTQLVPNELMTWSGGLPLGLFRGVRTFRVRETGADTTQFTLREVLSGPMLNVIRSHLPDMSEPFDKFAKGLKQRAERGV